MTCRLSIAPALILLACSISAVAQDYPPAAVDPKACAPSERMPPPREGREGSAATSGSGEGLSDKLARTDGVICPPDVDPEIKAPTPNAGRTPVIPPPGSPGADPTVRPK
jgi:hypothetical protein